MGCIILGVYLKDDHKCTSSILNINLIPSKSVLFVYFLQYVYFDYIICILQVYYTLVRVHIKKPFDSMQPFSTTFFF